MKEQRKQSVIAVFSPLPWAAPHFSTTHTPLCSAWSPYTLLSPGLLPLDAHQCFIRPVSSSPSPTPLLPTSVTVHPLAVTQIRNLSPPWPDPFLFPPTASPVSPRMVLALLTFTSCYCISSAPGTNFLNAYMIVLASWYRMLQWLAAPLRIGTKYQGLNLMHKTCPDS